jgi:hypothetical protein
MSKYTILFLCLTTSLFTGCSFTPMAPSNDATNKQAEITTARNTASLAVEPTKIALLLPLAGQFAPASQAIRSGFLAVYYYDRIERPNINIRIIDTTTDNIQRLYQQAVDDGAEVIVGPLIKKDVEALAKMSNLSVPTIALNTLDDYAHNHTANLYQFGLLPQDEATQTAARMLKEGIIHCAVIAPKGAWGEKIMHAFRDTYESGGGTIVATLNYAGTTNLAEKLCPFLAADADILCAPKTKTTEKNSQLSPTPTRRQDINGIFLVANPAAARQIVPLLKFYYAGDLPVYSISAIYSSISTPILDQDIDGVYFCDMPWVLQDPSMFSEDLQHIHGQLVADANNNSALNKHRRLYALGIDSYKMATKLPDFLNGFHQGISGASGKLYLDNFNHIYRELYWAKMQHGVPILVP